MKRYVTKLPVLLLFLLFVIPASYAQQFANTGSGSAYPNTIEQEPIYRGAEYRLFPFTTVKGIPWFAGDTLSNGKVTYYGRRYDNVPLMYDQTSDELITVDLSGNMMIRMYSPKVDSFFIHDSHFVFISDTANALRNGFWEVLNGGKTKLLKREVKTIRNRIIDSKIARVIQSQIFYRLGDSGAWHEVSGKEDILNVFSNKKEPVQAFMKSNRKRFRKAGFETMLKETAAFYNELQGRQ